MTVKQLKEYLSNCSPDDEVYVGSHNLSGFAHRLTGMCVLSASEIGKNILPMDNLKPARPGDNGTILILTAWTA